MQQQEGLILPGRGLPNGVGSVNAASANAVIGPNRWGMQQAGSAATGRYTQPHKPTPTVKQSEAPASKPGMKQVETCVSVSSQACGGSQQLFLKMLFGIGLLWQ